MLNMFTSWFGGSTPVPSQAPTAVPKGDPSNTITGLAEAISAAAPRADVATWSAALTPWLTKAEITTPRRVSAFFGQCAVEAGPGLSSLRENLTYTHAARLCVVFPREFPTEAAAAPYVCQPEKLASVVYANRLGNGPASTGDGGRFCGGGLLQITGRSAYTSCGVWCDKTPEQVAAWVQTPEGAAASACWYWSSNNLNALADTWSLSTITRRINGPAMEGNAARIAAANAALAAMGGH